MTDLEFLQEITKVISDKPIQIKMVKETGIYGEKGMITIDINNCLYTAWTLKECIDMIKSFYAELWLNHVKKENKTVKP